MEQLYSSPDFEKIGGTHQYYHFYKIPPHYVLKLVRTGFREVRPDPDRQWYIFIFEADITVDPFVHFGFPVKEQQPNYTYRHYKHDVIVTKDLMLACPQLQAHLEESKWFDIPIVIVRESKIDGFVKALKGVYSEIHSKLLQSREIVENIKTDFIARLLAANPDDVKKLNCPVCNAGVAISLQKHLIPLLGKDKLYVNCRNKACYFGFQYSENFARPQWSRNFWIECTIET